MGRSLALRALAMLLALPAAALAQAEAGPRWSAGPALAIPRDHHAVFTVEQGGRTWLYVAGGTNYRDMFADVTRAEVLADGTLGDWQTATPLPGPRAGLAAVAVGDVVVVSGGQIQVERRLPRIDEVFTARVAADGSIGEWRAAAPLPAPRFHHPLVAHEGRVYVVGGQGAREAETGVFVARVDADGTISEWVETTPLPRARSHHAALVHDGHVYVFGGLDGAPGLPQAGFFDVIRALIQPDGMLGAWENAGMLPHSLATHSATVHDGAVWLLGGVEDLQRFVATVWRAPLDDEGGIGEWSSVEPALPTARGHVHVVPAIGDRMYSIGGRTLDGVTGDVVVGRFP